MNIKLKEQTVTRKINNLYILNCMCIIARPVQVKEREREKPDEPNSCTKPLEYW